MSDDEKKIRELVSTWMRASAARELDAILPLMSDDVVFLQPGRAPMRGRDAFADAFRAGQGKYRMMCDGEVIDLHVAGDLAYGTCRLSVTIFPLPDGDPIRKSGETLSIFRRQPGGAWVIVCDANLLS